MSIMISDDVLSAHRVDSVTQSAVGMMIPRIGIRLPIGTIAGAATNPRRNDRLFIGLGN